MKNINMYGKIPYEVLGKVVDISDPKKMRRIKVTVPELCMKENETLPWALPCLSHKSDFLPAKDDYVWIRFRGFDPSKPIYTGFAFYKDQVTQEFLDEYSNENRVDYDDVGNKRIWNKNGWKIISLSGDKIELYNDPDNKDNNYIKIHDTFENEILKNKDGIYIKDTNDNTVELKQGEINITGEKINLLSAAEPVILGQTFDTWINEKLIVKYLTHTHDCPQSPSGTNKTTPPLGDPLLAPRDHLSQKIKVE